MAEYTREQILAGIERAKAANRPDAVADLEARLKETEAAAEPAGPSLMDRASDATRKFFDPTYGTNRPNDLWPVAQGALKAASVGLSGFSVPALAASGALLGAGSSDASTPGGVAKDATEGAGASVVGGKVIQGVGKGIKLVAGPLAEWLKARAVENGRKALSGISTPMSHNRAPIPADAVEAAYKSGSIKPWDTVTSTAEKLEGAVDRQSALYDALIARLEAAGVEGPSAHTVARRLLNRADAESAVTWAKFDPIVGDLKDVAEEVVTKVDPLKVYTHGVDPAMPLTQVRALVGNAQRAAKGEYAKVPSAVSLKGDAQMAVAGELRQALEDAVQSQAAKAPEAVASFMPEKKQLSDLLWALTEARMGAGKAARRGPLSLSDMIAASGAGGAAGPAGVAASLATTRAVLPRLAALKGNVYRTTGQAAEALAGLNPGKVPTAAPAGASMSPAAMEELAKLVEFLKSRGRPGLAPAGADDEQ